MPFKDKEYEKQYKKARYLQKKEEISAYNKARRQNKEIYARDRVRITEWMLNNTARRLYIQAKKRSQKDGADFDIDLTDIVIPEVCPYLGLPLTNTLGQGKQQLNPSIDRIDNSKGYVKGNIMVISHMANSMKRDATLEQLIAFAKGVLSLHNPE